MIADNRVSSFGAIALAEMLLKNSRLTELNLTRNFVGDMGAAALGKALEKNRSLMYLFLAGF